MNRPATIPPTPPSPRRRPGLTGYAAILAGLAAAAATAQYALDASLRVGQTRNVANTPVTMQGDPYTISRNTGEFVYNRAVAFQDRAYNIYQRRNLNLYDTPTRNTLSTAGQVTRPRSATPERATVPTYQQPRHRSTRALAPQTTRVSALRAPAYTPSRPRATSRSALTTRTYSPGAHRSPGARRINTRVR